MGNDSGGGSLWQKLTRFFGGKDDDDPLEQAIIEASQEGELEEHEGSMLLSILHLDDRQVQEIMTPRSDITAVSLETTIAEAAMVILDTGHSRLPIYRHNNDNIVGIVYAKDLLREVLKPGGQQNPVESIMHKPFFVPETKNVLELLNEFRARKTHMAVILDEFGGTSGLVTIEDVLEEIVGDIEDEHDAPKKADIKLMEDGSAMLTGRAYLEDINDQLELKLYSDEVDTIGGLLAHVAGRLPRAGEEFLLENTRFVIKKADARQILSVLATPMQNTASADGPSLKSDA